MTTTEGLARDALNGNGQATMADRPLVRRVNSAERVAASGLLWGCVGVCALLLCAAGLGLVRLLQWLW